MFYFLAIPLFLVFIQQTASIPCGIPSIEPDISEEHNFKIFGGREAKPYSWPWMVKVTKRILRTKDGKPFSIFSECAGALIDPQWVLTALHCVFTPFEEVTVRLGIHKLSDGADVKQILKKAQVIPWSSSRNITVRNMNDIALLKLNSPVTLGNHIHPICLPTDDRRLVRGQQLWMAIGWGSTNEATKQGISNALQQAQLEVTHSNSKCRREDFDFTNHLCAGSDTSGICSGDSGGPLMVKKDNKWIQIGVSNGSGINETRCDTSYGVFARVSQYCSWIQEKIGHQICDSY